MSIISTILSGGVGELIKGIGSVVDNLHTSKEEKNAAKLALEELARKSVHVPLLYTPVSQSRYSMR